MKIQNKRFIIALLALACIVLGGSQGWDSAYFTAIGLIVSVYIGGDSWRKHGE